MNVTPQPPLKISPEIVEEFKKKAVIVDEVKELLKDGKLAEAYKILMQEAEESECTLCGDYLGAEAARVGYLTKVCQLDDKVCNAETKTAQTRMDEVKTLFMQAGGLTPTTEPNKTYTDDRHRHIAEMSKDPRLAGHRQWTKIYVGNKTFKDKTLTPDAALAMCKNEHPDWFEG